MDCTNFGVHGRAGLFSADFHHVVAGMAAVGRPSAGLSPGQCAVARVQRGGVVAGAGAAENSGGLAGGGGVCLASGQRGIGGVDHRTQEHAGDVVLCVDAVVVSAI